MKLNVDAVRKILFCLEQNLLVSEEGEFQCVGFRNISEWCELSVGETLNTLCVLRDAGAIACDDDFGCDIVNEFDVSRLTYFGYQLLESLKPEAFLQKLKAASEKGISVTFETIIQSAKSLAVPAIVDFVKKNIV